MDEKGRERESLDKKDHERQKIVAIKKNLYFN